ncbi:MAG TPA: ATP-binding cassette domain-containing protein, partial [Candidatus Cloacimonadota bacterium]|nr:ATP-binding cassette domain-containing protein [Candidatus Cloacimonadota bacterium]
MLCDLDFDLDEGEFVSIIGASGCGKTTFLELLAGITLPDRGEICYEGKQITGKSGILGYMPQDDLLLPWLDTIGNILLPARVQSRDVKALKHKIADLLPTFGLEDFSHHLPWQLSGGLKQRVALAR